MVKIKWRNYLKSDCWMIKLNEFLVLVIGVGSRESGDGSKE